jgi:glyoxylase-like metal-dependent hydrolase (beta-lactamase superfamily II)
MRTVFRTAAIATFALMTATGTNLAQQQQDFSKIEVTTTDLGHNVYMLQGAGGNVTVAVGTDGVIMVDTQFAPMHEKLKAAIAKLTTLPVKYVINTHHHGDHTGGNAAFGMEGAVIVAQNNVKGHLTKPLPGANGQAPPATPAAGLPITQYGESTTISVAGQTAQLIHVANAHTDGDTFVYFTDADVLAIGDTGGANRYPGVDVRGGGSINGTIAAAEIALAKANANTKIVPGHGALATKAEIQAYHDTVVTIADRIVKYRDTERFTEDQAVAAQPLIDIQEKLKQNAMASERLVRLVYETVKTSPLKK